MTRPTADEVRARMAEALGVTEARLQPEAELVELVSDSYRLVEMAIELQEDYDVILTQADLNGVTSVADLVELIRARFDEA